MNIEKQAKTQLGGTPTPEQLEKINCQSKGALTAEEVYVFSIRLLDDQEDRDGEKFATEALEPLGRMFIGKPGIVDHNWSAEKQAARIFDTEVVREADQSWLRAWAYIPRSGREALIADIESGIRREVSVSCSMGRRSCSVCGAVLGACNHRRGESYNGTRCVAVLEEPQDAYEFSFVAVPAQRAAGVVKAYGGGETKMQLGEIVEKAGSPEATGEYRRLKVLAAYGERRQARAQQETVRMALALELGMEKQMLEQIVKTLGPEELEAVYAALMAKMKKRFPGIPQLETQLPQTSAEESAYLI